MKTLLRQSLLMTFVMMVGTGIIFPVVVTLLAKVLFPYQAKGSLIKSHDGVVIGSELLGQNFALAKYFHPRPSAAGAGYDAANSSGTNLGPTSKKLINGIVDDPATPTDESYSGVNQLAEQYRAENGLDSKAVLPADAATRSGSGLDPHISPRNAELQVSRVATARGIKESVVQSAIAATTAGRFLGVFGEPRVNVLKLNLFLDQQK